MIPKLILAPMAGVNCPAFRLLCKEYGADLIYTQMYYVSKINEIENLKDYFNINSKERPVAIQLIGGLNDDWESAVKKIDAYADIIDINLGCPESEALDKKSGAYLLNQPNQIKKIILKIKSSTNKPISAKIRSGWNENNALEISKNLETENISAIAIHPRTKKQAYTGKADWNIIKKIKENIDIPVFGNGDIILAGHAKAMVEQTKCDGIMIGRTAMKNPAIFYEIKYLFENNKNISEPISKKKQIQRFIEIYETIEKEQKLNQIKDHCCWISSDLVNSKEIKEHIRLADSIDEIKKIVENMKQ